MNAINLKHQQGVVLVISLIILFAMTLVGVTAIRTTSMQERMSGNIQDKYLSFQQAETALREGEVDLTNEITGGTSTLTYYVPSSCSPNCWSDSNTTWSADDYILEDLGKAPLNEDCSLILPPDTSCYVGVFRVTGQGQGQQSGTLSVVQSTFKLTE